MSSALGNAPRKGWATSFSYPATPGSGGRPNSSDTGNLSAIRWDRGCPIVPPRIFPGLETRAVRIRPEVVLSCDPIDLNIVVERLNLPEPDRFDLIIGTNIFVYYDAFEQALALENAGAMLKPGGLLLTNDRLPAVPGGSMRLAGVTVVPFESPGANPTSRRLVPQAITSIARGTPMWV